MYCFYSAILQIYPKILKTQVVDLHFALKQSLTQRNDQENVVREQRSHKISKDVLIIGIDSRTLDVFGRWPFHRTVHADLLDAFSRVKEQNDRESVILLDILFNEVADRAFEDAILLDSIEKMIGSRSKHRSMVYPSRQSGKVNMPLGLMLCSKTTVRLKIYRATYQKLRLTMDLNRH